MEFTKSNGCRIYVPAKLIISIEEGPAPNHVVDVCYARAVLNIRIEESYPETVRKYKREMASTLNQEQSESSEPSHFNGMKGLM